MRAPRSRRDIPYYTTQLQHCASKEFKQYFEQINVVGITFKYSDDGVPVGLCRAKRLFYVTTAGGHYVPETFGFGYVKALAQNYYGIQDIRQIEAVGLDIDGADVDAIMKAAKDALSGIESV